MNEAEIQSQFVCWLTARNGYQEVFADPNGGAGALMDSIGQLSTSRRAVLIEFKRQVAASGVRYSPTMPSSIERKIRNSLQALYEGRILDDWARQQVPLVRVVAGRISESACRALKLLLEERAPQWHFEYEIGEWDGAGYRSLARGPVESIAVTEWQNVTFPEMPWPGEKRLPRRKLAELREVAATRGVVTLFDDMIRGARSHRLTLSCNRENLVLGGRANAESRFCRVASIWPGDSGTPGLCVGTSVEGSAAFFGVRTDPSMLPGTPAPIRGYLGERRFLATSGQILQYWTALTAGRVVDAL